MTNKEIVQKVINGFSSGDEDAILKYLADDIRWEVPGDFVAHGIEEYRKRVKNDEFVEDPVITVKNEIEEGSWIAVEGYVTRRKVDGTMFGGSFCDTFKIEDGKIKEMTFYILPKELS